MSRPRPPWVVLVLGLVLAVGLAGCPPADEPPDDDAVAPPVSEVTVTAGDIYFRPAQLEARAGSIEVTLVNDGRIPHTWVIEGMEDRLRLEVLTEGATDSGTIELEAGTYTFYCDVPGHREAGQEGVLTVR